MILSARSRYAVMAMADLASHAREKPVKLAEIAHRQEVPLSFLEQIFTQLRQHGLVRSVKGPGGGYLLAEDPQNLLISRIVIATEEDITATRCGKSPAGCLASREQCLTHDLWAGLTDHIMQYLSSVSLQDLCQKKQRKEVARHNAAR